MKKNSLAPLVVGIIFFAGCGKKGPIYPPLPLIPMTAQDVNVLQKGNEVMLRWVNPTTYEDGNLLADISKVEIWLLEREVTPEEEPVPSDIFAKAGQMFLTIGQDDFAGHTSEEDRDPPRLEYAYRMEKAQRAKWLYFSFRVIDRRGRASLFSGPHKVEPKTLPLPPQKPQVTQFEDRIELTWQAPLANIDGSMPSNLVGYNIYRLEEVPEGSENWEEKDRRKSLVLLNRGLVEESKFEDKNFLFGYTYLYMVRASATESAPYLESGDSEEIILKAVDSFPPAVPKGLVTIAGAEIIGLSWDANKEVDFKGYHVYRRLETEIAYMLLTPEPIRENACNDTLVEKNRRYYYAISALDKFGNESKNSKEVSDTIRNNP